MNKELNEVAPAEPDVKPKRQVPKIKPGKNDPWNVPGPKVSPGPKA